MTSLRLRITAFLDGPGAALAIVGPSGTGKLYATQLAAQDKGLVCAIHDRSQGAINYKLWGAPTIKTNGGLALSLQIILGADCETDFSFVSRLPQGCKVILIANTVASDAMRRIPIERVRPPTAQSMEKILFEDGWDALAARRLSSLARGDWRQVHTLNRTFKDAGIDITSATEEAFAHALQQMTRDRQNDAHPSLRAHQLFTGIAQPEDADAAVVAWSEKNLGITCGTLADYAMMQEAAVTADLLCNGGEYDLGLDHFARSAAVLHQTGLRYDYAKWSNPWAAPSEKTTKDIRESFEKNEPWSRTLKRRLAAEQYPSQDDAPPKPKAKAKARATRKAKSTVQ